MAQPWVNSEARVNEVYQPLDTSSTQIRVAILQPRQSADTYVVVSLQTVSLSDSPQFDALSWVWGDPKDVRPIILEGELWWAPKNLVIALEHLRPESAPRVIWIDALCINQSETTAGLAERGHQIGLMRRIYTTANRVLVWMGLEREWTKGVLSLLTDVADNAQDFGDEPPSLPRPYHVPYTESWKVLHLLSEPWWDRVWVLQEVGLAKEAVLYHGIHSMPFTKALRAINLLESRHHLPGKGPEFETKLGPFNNLYSDGLSFRLPKTSFSPLYPRENVFALFISLMVACRFRSATNPGTRSLVCLDWRPTLFFKHCSHDMTSLWKRSTSAQRTF
jgi:Heterokaryon incompatibility protein (HET)